MSNPKNPNVPDCSSSGHSLTKTSPSNEVRAYFEAVFNLRQSNEAYPVDLDEVYPLVYSAKEKAVRALKENFIQDVDFQVLAQNGENPTGGRPIDVYMLSVSCMEYFIARKIRPVFDVYREVFHKAATPPKVLTPAELLLSQAQLAVEQDKRIATLEERMQVIEDTVHPPTAVELRARGYGYQQIAMKLDIDPWEVLGQVWQHEAKEEQKRKQASEAKQAPPAPVAGIPIRQMTVPDVLKQCEIYFPEPSAPAPAVPVSEPKPKPQRPRIVRMKKVMEMHNSGMPIAKIAYIMDLTKSTVRSYINHSNFEPGEHRNLTSDYLTIAEFSNRIGYKFTLNEVGGVAQKALKMCKKRGATVQKQADRRQGFVYMYPIDILKEVFANMKRNIKRRTK